MPCANVAVEPMARRTLSREAIIRRMADDLRPLRYVHAFWESGSTAFDRTDAWSDIDLYIVVDDAMVRETFAVVEKTLTALSPIRLKHEVPWPAASGIYQAFYRLEKTDEYRLVDLAIMTVSAPDKFLAREIGPRSTQAPHRADGALRAVRPEGDSSGQLARGPRILSRTRRAILRRGAPNAIRAAALRLPHAVRLPRVAEGRRPPAGAVGVRQRCRGSHREPSRGGRLVRCDDWRDRRNDGPEDGLRGNEEEARKGKYFVITGRLTPPHFPRVAVIAKNAATIRMSTTLAKPLI